MKEYYEKERELASVYHDLEGISSFIECIEEKTDDTKLLEYLLSIKQHLTDSRIYLIETVVRDVMGAYRKELPINRDGTTIGLLEAKNLSSLLEAEARRKGISVVIAIADSSAHPILVHSMENARIASYEIAVNKAYTSASMKLSTKELKLLAAPGQELYGIQNTNQGRIIIFGGGETLIHNSKIIGAIGISGGSEAEDIYLAEYGTKRLKEVISWK